MSWAGRARYRTSKDAVTTAIASFSSVLSSLLPSLDTSLENLGFTCITPPCGDELAEVSAGVAGDLFGANAA